MNGTFSPESNGGTEVSLGLAGLGVNKLPHTKKRRTSRHRDAWHMAHAKPSSSLRGHIGEFPRPSILLVHGGISEFVHQTVAKWDRNSKKV